MFNYKGFRNEGLFLTIPFINSYLQGLMFEVGGKSKPQNQIERDGKSYEVKDDIEFGYLNVIPLWAFGLNY